jgi:hypothetical protein
MPQSQASGPVTSSNGRSMTKAARGQARMRSNFCRVLETASRRGAGLGSTGECGGVDATSKHEHPTGLDKVESKAL